MYIKKIYEYKIHNIDIWSINQLCTQRFPWPLFSRVLWILQKRWWTWFLSTTSNRSIQDFTNFSNGQGILTVFRVTMDVNTWKVEHLICLKKTVERKGMTTFFDWCKQNAHHPIHNLKLLFGNCNCHERSTVFLNPRESRPFFYLQEIGGYIYIYTYI